MPTPSSGRSKELILAIQIEKRYTKREIFTIYCNQMYLGHGAYGVEAASRLYFGKSNKQLDARGSGAHRRHVPDARAAEPVRRHEARRSRGATSCCSAWPTRATSRRRRPTPPRRSRSSRADSPTSRRASRRSSSRRSASTSSRQYGAKVLYESGLSVTTTLDRDAAAGGERGRRKRAAAGSTSAAGLPARRSATSSAEGHTIDDVQGRALEPADGRRRHRAGGGRHGAREPARRAFGSARYHGRPGARRASPGRGATSAAELVQAGDLDRRSGQQDRRGGRRPPRSRSSRRRSSKARSWRSTTGPDRFRRWSAAGASTAASSTARCRRTGSSDRPSSRSSTRPRSTAASRRRRCSSTSRSAIRSGSGRGLQPAELRPQVRRAGHAAPRARGLAQYPGDQDDGGPRARRTSSPIAKRFGFSRELSAVSADCAGRRRRHAARGDERLHGVSESGRADEAVRHPQGQGSRRQPARGEPLRAGGRHPRRHRVRDDQPAARRRAAGHRRRPRRASTGRWRARPAPSTTTPTPGSSDSIRTSPSASGSASTRRSRSEETKQARSPRCRSGWSS